jgi:hypothetical protein
MRSVSCSVSRKREEGKLMASRKKSPTSRPKAKAAAKENVIVSADETAGPVSEEEAHASLADLGPESPSSLRDLAEDLPEKDEVQEAYKDQMLADDMQVAAEAKVRAVEASPNAAETPSGGALIATAHIAHDGDRGEAYAREKSARRWGYITPDLAEKDK